jgi:hypothetical protein
MPNSLKINLARFFASLSSLMLVVSFIDTGIIVPLQTNTTMVLLYHNAS